MPQGGKECTHSWYDVASCATLGTEMRKHLFAREPFALRELSVAVLDGLANVVKTRLV